jgi:hypothetical protein
MNRENLNDRRTTGDDSEFLARDRDGEVDADRRPELDLHGVWGSAVEGTDAQALLHPAEEQLDLPALAVELRKHGGWQRPLIGPDGQTHGLRHIVDSHASHPMVPAAGRSPTVESDGLIGPQ